MELIENNEIENNILIILLQHQEKQEYIFSKCLEEFFVNRTNKRIFKTAKELFFEGIDVDNVTIFEACNKDEDIGENNV